MLQNQVFRVIPDRPAIEEKIKTWPEHFAVIARKLIEGESLQVVAQDCGVNRPFVRGIAREIGWTCSWRTFGSSSHKVFGQNNLPWTFSKEEYEKGATLQQIGDAARCTRERVRQVLFYQGVVPRADIIPRRTAARAEQKAALKIEQAKRLRTFRAEAYLSRYLPWRKLWAKGASLKEMAEILGVGKNSIGCTMVSLRAKHPDWFPYRYPAGRRLASKEGKMKAGLKTAI